MHIIGSIIFLWIMWHAFRGLSKAVVWIYGSQVVQSLMSKTPGYWKYRKWISIPVMGYRRSHVLLLFLICVGIAIQLVVYTQVLLPVPKLRLGEVNTALDRNWPQLSPLEALSWSDRRKPVDGPVSDLPFPTLRMSIQNGQFQSGPPASKKRLKRTQPAETKNQWRSVTCSVATDGSPTCLYEADLPILHEFGVYKNQSTSFPLGSIVLPGLKLQFRVSQKELKARWRSHKLPPVWRDLRTRNVGSTLKIRVPAKGKEYKDLPEWQAADVAPFLAIANGDRALTVEITTDPAALVETAQSTCRRRANNANSGGKPLGLHCKQVLGGDLTYITSRCPRNEETGAWMCPWSREYNLFFAKIALESDTETHDTVYEFDTPDDRAFMAMFLRVGGFETAPVEITPRLERLRDQIVTDYRTVLGLDETFGQIPSEITGALTRQPQLFPYYRDRDFWAQPIMADLERKLDTIGISRQGAE